MPNYTALLPPRGRREFSQVLRSIVLPVAARSRGGTKRSASKTLALTLSRKDRDSAARRGSWEDRNDPSAGSRVAGLQSQRIRPFAL